VITVKQPVPPRNIHLVYLDGTVIPLDSVYVGTNEEGLHTWVVMLPLRSRHARALKAGVAAVGIDMLPAHTVVGMSFT
jgi:hypothetical protein